MIVSKTVAMRDPKAHKFVGGVGYVRLGEKLARGSFPVDRCTPPEGTEERSYHLIHSPGGGEPVVFRWVKGCWVNNNPSSNRLGYSPEYLSSHGWTLVRVS